MAQQLTWRWVISLVAKQARLCLIFIFLFLPLNLGNFWVSWACINAVNFNCYRPTIAALFFILIFKILLFNIESYWVKNHSKPEHLGDVKFNWNMLSTSFYHSPSIPQSILSWLYWSSSAESASKLLMSFGKWDIIHFGNSNMVYIEINFTFAWTFLWLSAFHYNSAFRKNL